MPFTPGVAYPTQVIDDDTGATTENIDREAPFGDRVLLVIDGAARGRDVAQVLNYQKAAKMRVGLLFNFGSIGKLEWKRFVI